MTFSKVNLSEFLGKAGSKKEIKIVCFMRSSGLYCTDDLCKEGWISGVFKNNIRVLPAGDVTDFFIPRSD